MKVEVLAHTRVVERRQNGMDIVNVMANERVLSLGLLYMAHRLSLPHLRASHQMLFCSFRSGQHITTTQISHIFSFLPLIIAPTSMSLCSLFILDISSLHTRTTTS